MSSDSSTIWVVVATVAAAIAAIFSAITARRVSLDAVRPELVLGDFLSPDEYGDFEFRTIRNVGRGPALHISFDLKAKGHPKADPGVHFKQISIVPANEARSNILGYCMVGLEDELGGDENIHLNLSVFCIDSHGHGHETRMHLVAARTSLGEIVGAEQLAPGLSLLSRRTFTKSPWRLRVANLTRFVKSKFKRKKKPSFRPSRMKDEKA